MPTYTYECPKCDRQEEAIRSIEDRNDSPMCCVKMNKIIVPLMVSPDYEEYINVINRKPVRGKRAHREFLKRNDCIEVG